MDSHACSTGGYLVGECFRDICLVNTWLVDIWCVDNIVVEYFFRFGFPNLDWASPEPTLLSGSAASTEDEARGIVSTDCSTTGCNHE